NLSESNSAWMEKPELVEIKAGTLGQGREAKRVFDFTMNVSIKRSRDAQQADKNSPNGAPAGNAAAAPGASTPVARPATGASAASAAVSAPAASAPAASAPKKP